MTARETEATAYKTTPANPRSSTVEDTAASRYEFDQVSVEHLTACAMSYLDTAEATLEAVNSYADHLITLKPENFSDTEISDTDLIKLADFGAEALAKADKMGRLQRVSGLAIPTELEYLIPIYRGLGESEVSAEALEPKNEERLAELTASPPGPSVAKPELDQYVSALTEAAQKVPSIRDSSTIAGLSFVRMAQFFEIDSIQKALPDNHNLGADFAAISTAKQGGYFATSYYVTRQPDLLKNTLQDMTPDSLGSPEERNALIESYMTEIELFESRREATQDWHSKVGAAYKAVIDTAISHAVSAMEELAGLIPGPDTMEEATWDELAAAAEIESRAVAVNKNAIRRTKKIINIANSLQTQHSLDAPRLCLERPFPDIKGTFAERLRKIESAKISDTIATSKAAEETSLQALRNELSHLRALYFMTRSEIKKIANHSELTSKLVKGEVGNEEEKADAMGKDDAYDITGLLYQLEKMLAEQPRNRVFDELFAAYEKEAEIVSQLDEQQFGTSLAASCDWLLSNVSHMQDSESELLNRIGDELVHYGRSRRATNMGQRLENSARRISDQTRQAIEAARIEAASLDIRAFPPGAPNIEALEEDALELATRPSSRKIVGLDWERLLELDRLSQEYHKAGFEAQLFRLLPGSLNEHFPYYALVINGAKCRVVVAENPKTNNATYVFEETDPQLATWTEIVQLNKIAVRELGGRALFHNCKKSTTEHFQRVSDEVTLRLSAN